MKYVDLVQIGSVVIEIRGVEMNDFAVPVRNIRTCVPLIFLGC